MSDDLKTWRDIRKMEGIDKNTMYELRVEAKKYIEYYENKKCKTSYDMSEYKAIINFIEEFFDLEE